MRCLPLVLFGATLLVATACGEKPAATVKEVNKLDADSGDAPNPIEDPRFKEFFDRVRDYMKVHDSADAKVLTLKDTSDPAKISGRERRWPTKSARTAGGETG
jgi:hypothetical protein